MSDPLSILLAGSRDDDDDKPRIETSAFAPAVVATNLFDDVDEAPKKKKETASKNLFGDPDELEFERKPVKKPAEKPSGDKGSAKPHADTGKHAAAADVTSLDEFDAPKFEARKAEHAAKTENIDRHDDDLVVAERDIGAMERAVTDKTAKKPAEKKAASSSVFDDDGDDDFFTKKKQPAAAAQGKSAAAAAGDDDDDDDFFAVAKNANKKVALDDDLFALVKEKHSAKEGDFGLGNLSVADYIKKQSDEKKSSKIFDDDE
eukprot:comp15357_c0_seq1/m.23247 comp15357_c0_seq1/g.23247  ORF comp15357_c0_seq1/g.23247 comp15357_c0_seq1/m.23247 type:complete len:261 (+) comp15357_c0_seq1:58-840(+)